MGKREVGLAGGIAAASAMGVARVGDNCASAGSRVASGGDDFARLGGRSVSLESGVGRVSVDELAARGLADDAVRARVIGAAGEDELGLGLRAAAADAPTESIGGRALGASSVEAKAARELLGEG